MIQARLFKIIRVCLDNNAKLFLFDDIRLFRRCVGKTSANFAQYKRRIREIR